MNVPPENAGILRFRPRPIAGIQCLLHLLVIPAKAGIQRLGFCRHPSKRWDQASLRYGYRQAKGNGNSSCGHRFKPKAFALRASDFCLGKSHQNRLLLTAAGTMKPSRCPALLGPGGTAPKLARYARSNMGASTAARACDARRPLSRKKAAARASQDPGTGRKERAGQGLWRESD